MRHAALLALLCAGVARTGAVVIGIDFGARFLKIAAIKPGSGIEMVFNEASKRTSAASVAFNLEDERILGDDAYNLAPKLPRRTYAYIKQLLGKGVSSPAVVALTKLGFPYAFETNKTSNTLAIRQDASTAYLVEELAAFILSYAKKISEDHLGTTVRDCVLAVPPFWKVSERLALMRAAEIANLNVLSLVHETTAVAFKYGFDKEALFAEKPLNVVFYDLGAAAYKVSVVEFASSVSKKNKTVGSLTVKGVAWDEGLGGVNFDACVADYLVDSFVKAHPKQGKTLRGSERGMAKIRKEAERIKETLSANAEIPVAIEALHEDTDFRMVMKRAEFEQRCDKLWPRFAKPLEAALAQAGLTAAQVDKVEIVGGATRIPRVKQLAKEFFNREQLDMSLNGDEACALGAALFAAKMSTSFRLREFVINDLYPHDLAVKLSGGAQFDAEEGEPGGKASKEKLLFAKGARFPRKKVLTLSRDADFSIDALVNGEPMASLEISGLAAGLATVKTPKREPVGKPKASVTFALSASGLLEVSKAEVMLDVMETYDEYVNVPIKDDDQQPAQEAAKEGKGDAGAAAGKEPADAAEPAADADAAGKEAGADGADGADGDADAAESAADDDAAAAADGEGKEEGEGAEGAAAGAADDKAEEKAEGKADDADAPKKGKGDASKPKAAKAKATKDKAKKKAPATRKEKVTKTAKRVHHVALKAAATYTTPVPVIGAAVIADCIARNQRMLDAEDVRRVDAEAKNRLEAYVLSTRDRLADDEERVALISTDAQRSELASRFEEVEEWLYEDGRAVTGDVYTAKADLLRALGEPIFERLAELDARPAAVEAARAKLSAAAATVATWAEEKQWISEEERAKTLELAANVTAWLDGVLAEQEGRPAHEPAAFTSASVEKKLQPLDKAVRILGKKLKPKPPKVEEEKPDKLDEAAAQLREEEGAAADGASDAAAAEPAAAHEPAEPAADSGKEEL